MARTTTVIDKRSLLRFERSMKILGDIVVPTASREAARDAGHQAQILLRVAFRRHDEGGPAPATRVIPGSPSSSVLVDEAELKGTDDVRVGLEVSRRATRWLQFQLGDLRRRRPGEVGVADSANFVPQARTLKLLMKTRMPYGNLPWGICRSSSP